MLPEDVFRPQLQSTITALRYWVPSISDTARVELDEAPDYWRMTVRPLLAKACPFELILRADQHYDICIGEECYEDRPLAFFGDFLPLAEAIAEGDVVQRHWLSRNTGAVRSVETVVSFENGRIWKDAHGDVLDMPPLDDDGTELRESRFLPYRR